MLRQGVTVSDILYLTPEGAPNVFRAPASALKSSGMSGWDDKRGYGFDGCSPNILMDRAEVKDGCIVFPGSTSYRLLVLPRMETMTPRLVTKIINLVEAGAVVYGAPPVASPSLSGYPECDVKVKELAAKLWGETGSPLRQVGQGRIILDADAGFGKKNRVANLYPGYAVSAAVLEGMGVSEDFLSDGPVRYGHRTTASDDIYFIANTSDKQVAATCTFRVQQGVPQLWNPVTAEIRGLPQFKHQDKTTSVPMKFEPYQSFFVIFPRKGLSKPTAAFGGLTELAAGAVNLPEVKPFATIEGAWEVLFDPKMGGGSEGNF